VNEPSEQTEVNEVNAETAKPSPDGLSLSAFARRHGVSVSAVSKAVKTGRLARSVGRIGWYQQPVIVDVARADCEWRENVSRPARSRLAVAQLEQPPRPGFSVCRDGSYILVGFRSDSSPAAGDPFLALTLAGARELARALLSQVERNDNG
jgi:hypothetical protein